MEQQNFNQYCNFLFFACKMPSLQIDGKNSVIRDVFCTKLAQLQQNGKLIAFTSITIKSMLSLQMATQVAEGIAKDFWEPLFSILAISIGEQ